MSKRKTNPPTCDHCGACCMAMGSPPFVGREEWEQVPEPLRTDTLNYIMHPRRNALGPDGAPCCWLDLATGKCRHYDIRPQICRDFDRGTPECRAHRESVGLTVNGKPAYMLRSSKEILDLAPC